MRKPTPEELLIKELDLSANSTKDMLAVLNDTKEIGKGIMQNLDAQGRQLQATQHDVDVVIQGGKSAERKIKSISSIFWDIINWFRSEPKQPNHNLEVNTKLAKEEAKKKKSTPSKKSSPAPTDVIGAGLTDPAAKEKYNDSEKYLDAAEEVVDDLHKMAVDMGKEINTHNKRLDMLDATSKEARVGMIINNTQTRILSM